MDLRELRYFAVLAEERHFGRAASRLFIAPSGLSRAIRRAESSLGVALFSRTPGSVELTAAGTALLEHVPGLLRTFDDLRADADAARAGFVGTLTVATSPVARYEVVPPILRRFSAGFPRVRLIRREQLAPAAVDDLAAGLLDVAIAFCAPARAGILREPLRSIELRLFVPATHPLAARGRVALSELRRERFLIHPSRLASGAASLDPLFLAAGFRPAYVPLSVDHDEDFHAVLRGDGLLLSGRTFLRRPPPGIAVLGLDPPAMLPLELLRRASRPSPLVGRFVELSRAVAAERGWPVTDDRPVSPPRRPARAPDRVGSVPRRAPRPSR